MKQYSFLMESSSIKHIDFPKEEISTLSKQDYFITTRVSDDYNKYFVNDIVITPWNKRYKIVKRINISSIKDHPYYKELTKDQVKFLSKFDKICVLFAKQLVSQKSIDVLKTKLKTIKYGLRDPKTNKQWKKWNEEKHCWKVTEDDYDKVWRLGTSQETLQSKIGICWDTVEVERDFLSKTDIEFKMFFAHGTVYEDPTHTWIIYKDTDNKWRWLERSWGTFENNNNEWDNWMDGVKQVTKHLVEYCDNHHRYTVYLLDKYPKPGCNSNKFQHECIKQRKII